MSLLYVSLLGGLDTLVRKTCPLGSISSYVMWCPTFFPLALRTTFQPSVRQKRLCASRLGAGQLTIDSAEPGSQLLVGGKCNELHEPPVVGVIWGDT